MNPCTEHQVNKNLLGFPSFDRIINMISHQERMSQTHAADSITEGNFLDVGKAHLRIHQNQVKHNKQHSSFFNLFA